MRRPTMFSFFFSSRRRHTRSLCDWSSDVCSSDLGISELIVSGADERGLLTGLGIEGADRVVEISEELAVGGPVDASGHLPRGELGGRSTGIGRKDRDTPVFIVEDGDESLSVGREADALVAVGVVGDGAEFALGIGNEADLDTVAVGIEAVEGQDAATIGEPDGATEDFVVRNDQRTNGGGGAVDEKQTYLGVLGLIGDERLAVGRPGDRREISDERAAEQGFFFTGGEVGDEHAVLAEVGAVAAHVGNALAVRREGNVTIDVTDDGTGAASQNRGAVEDQVIRAFRNGAPEVDEVSVGREVQAAVVNTLGGGLNLGIAVAGDVANPQALEAVLIFLDIQDVFAVGRGGGEGGASGGSQFLN